MNKTIKYLMYSACLVFMLAVVVGYNKFGSDIQVENDVPISIDYDYVTDIITGQIEQVSKNEKNILIKPYMDKNVKILKGYYDYKADTKEQQNSITYYEGTYMQNSGIIYGTEEKFDVYASLSGEVTEVVKDELIGNSITIKNKDNTFTVYQSIDDIQVKKGDVVEQGEKIATSGTSNIDKELKNHLYFELIIDEYSVNPEEYYDKEV